MTSRLAGALVAMAALLATGLSTGGQIYYLLFYTLLLLTLLSLISVLWLLYSVRIEMRGVKPRVERGEAMMTIFTVRHTSPLPVAALRIRLNVPSAFSAAQEISVSTRRSRRAPSATWCAARTGGRLSGWAGRFLPSARPRRLRAVFPSPARAA